MSMTDIRKAAQAEHRAEGNREQAEARWRKAWWATTFALAEPERKPDVSEAYNVAKEELGQGIDYLRKRRAAGIAFQALKGLELPPRLSLSWLEAHRGEKADESVAEELRQAEADGLSLREYAAQYEQRFETPPPPAAPEESPEEIAAKLPPAVIAKQASRPDVARAIARNDAAREAVEEEAIEVRATQRIPGPTDREVRDTAEGFRRDMGRNLGKETDLATDYLNGAASDLSHAVMSKEDYGIDFPEAEAEALERVKRALAVYEAGADGMSQADREFLASIGVSE